METYNTLYNCICRLCLKFNKSDNMIPLFELNSGKTNYYGKAVTKFSEILLDNKDSLPLFMCKMCLQLLKQCIRFKFMCEANEKYLKRIKNFATDNCFKQRVVEYTLLKHNNLSDRFYRKQVNKHSSRIKQTNCSEKLQNNLKENKPNHWLDYDLGIEASSASPLKTECNKSNPDEIISAIENSLPKLGSTDNLSIKRRRKLRRIVKENLKRLKETESVVKRKYLCEICNKTLSNRQTHKHHMQRHKGFRYICEHCGKGFAVLTELQRHLVVKHGKGPYLQCQHCPFKAPRKFDLVEHERIHSKERPYACDKCGLTFRRRNIWKNHMVYHTEKTVQCTACPKKFYMRSQMLSHYNNVHDRTYMYVCERCGALYAKPATVRRHLIDRHGVPRQMQGKILRVKKSSGFKDDR